jgi:hypothetical protein
MVHSYNKDIYLVLAVVPPSIHPKLPAKDFSTLIIVRPSDVWTRLGPQSYRLEDMKTFKTYLPELLSWRSCICFDAEKSCPYCGHTTGEEPLSRKQILWNEFRGSYCSNSTPNYEPRKNVEECEDYTNVFLCHARVYVFAEKYDVAKLRALALHKLQQPLEVFQVY